MARVPAEDAATLPPAARLTEQAAPLLAAVTA